MFEAKTGFKRCFKYVEAISLNVQYILFALEENVVHQRSKPEDPSKVPNPHWFGPPTSIPCWHHRQEEEALHQHTRDNKSKA
jgi:hypothetical protein